MAVVGHVFFLLCCLPCILCTSSTKHHGYYASTNSIEGLSLLEIKLLRDVEAHVQSLEEKVSSIKKILSKVAPEVNKRATPLNPLCATMIFKRFTMNWWEILSLLKDDKLETQRKDILETESNFPNSDDIEGALNGIFLLQETYNLDPYNLSMGLIQNEFMDESIQEEFQLSITDMEFLSKLSFNRGFYDRALEWITAAISKDDDLEATSIRKKRLRKLKATMIKSHDEVLLKRKRPRGLNWRTYITPFDHKLAKKKKYARALKENSGKRSYRAKLTKYLSLEKNDNWELFNMACRGENMRSPLEEKKLRSFYLHYNDPYLRLGPFKVEPQSLEPSLVVFKDFISEAEGESYIRIARDNLTSSATINKDGEETTVITRTSKQSWISEYDHPGLSLKITRRIELATALDAREAHGSEAYQVANYGIGGVYNTHMDAGGTILPNVETDGDRLGTFMAYLSDVKAGGGTAFPRLGIKVTAEKGAGVFWYNVDKNSVLDFKTFHGGCPVLSGTKWITNKWIRQYPNLLSRPCATSSNSQFQRFETPKNL